MDVRQDVGLAEDEELLAVNLDCGAAILAVEDLVALGDVKRSALAGVLIDSAVTDGQDLALLGLLLGGIGQDDATGRGLLLLDCPDDQTIAKGLQLHIDLRLGSVDNPWHSHCESANVALV